MNKVILSEVCIVFLYICDEFCCRKCSVNWETLVEILWIYCLMEENNKQGTTILSVVLNLIVGKSVIGA